jgi:hypothetical protein
VLAVADGPYVTMASRVSADSPPTVTLADGKSTLKLSSFIKAAYV